MSVFSYKYDNIPLSESFKTRKIIFISDLLSKCLIWQYFIPCFKKKSALAYNFKGLTLMCPPPIHIWLHQRLPFFLLNISSTVPAESSAMVHKHGHGNSSPQLYHVITAAVFRVTVICTDVFRTLKVFRAIHYTSLE